jgi:ABC-2 type transport system permease protein
VADTTDHPRLHWALPLGWAEELRPFVGARPAALLLPAAASLALLALAFALERRRDLGLGLLAPHDTRRPRRWLLGSELQFAARAQASGLAVWALGVGAFAAVLGTVAKSVAEALSADLRERLGQFGADLVTVSGVLGLYFLFFVLAIALFCCSQLGTARAEEAEGRLETLYALPVSRVNWLAGRLALAVAGATLLGLVASLAAATAATASGARVSYLRLLGAGLNCLPASLLFLGAGALLVACFPRQGVGVSYALVSLAFAWELVGGLLDAPGWLLGLSPFNQIGLVPAQPFRALPAAGMLAIGVAGMAGALLRFRARDLVGA